MIKVKARIKLFKGDQKRKTPFTNGYRPLFNFIKSMKTSGLIKLLDRTEFYPGDEGLVEIMFLNKDYLGDNFREGVRFTFDEGIETLGEGEVIKLL